VSTLPTAAEASLAAMTERDRPTDQGDGDPHDAGDVHDIYDLRRIMRDHAWPRAQATALRNTCAAAASKETLPAEERAFAAAIVAALDGTAPGISAAHMRILADSGLTGMQLDPPES
jgi:hypothetical protein